MCARKTSSKQLVDFASSFFTDLYLEDMVYGVLIRSPRSQGQIKSITHHQLPENYVLYTASDIPGKKIISILDTDIPVFAAETVSYIGEPVGILVGPNKDTVKKLASEVVVRFHDKSSFSILEHMAKNSETDTVQALLPAPTTESAEKNSEADVILAEKYLCNDENIDSFFSGEYKVISNTFTSKIKNSLCKEPSGGLAVFNKNVLQLYAPVQWFSQVRKAVSGVLNIPLSNIEIKTTQSAGGQNVPEWSTVVLAAQLSVASFLSKKPVKLELSVAEEYLYYEKPVGVVSRYKMAVTRRGVIKAADISITLDAGSYNPFIEEIVDRMTVAATGIYSIPVYRIRVVAKASDQPPTALNLNRIDSKIFFALETQIQSIADAVGFLSSRIRMRNFKESGQSPFVRDFSFFREVLSNINSQSTFKRKSTVYNNEKKYEDLGNLDFSIPIRGIGMGIAFEGSGFLGSIQFSSEMKMKLSLEKDGKLIIHSYPPSSSVKNIWISIVAKEFDVQESSVFIDSDFDIDAEPLHPAGFFGNIGVMTSLLRKCCTAIKKKRFRQALPITVSRGITRGQKKQWDPDTFTGNPFLSTSMGAAVVELEVDVTTYELVLRSVWITIESGEIFNKEKAGAVVKTAVRQCLKELVVGEELECENIYVNFITSSEEPKQLGTVVYSSLPAAFAGAVSQAYNVPILSLPIHMDELLERSLKRSHSSEIQCHIEGVQDESSSDS